MEVVVVVVVVVVVGGGDGGRGGREGRGEYGVTHGVSGRFQRAEPQNSNRFKGFGGSSHVRACTPLVMLSCPPSPEES